MTIESYTLNPEADKSTLQDDLGFLLIQSRALVDTLTAGDNYRNMPEDSVGQILRTLEQQLNMAGAIETRLGELS